MPVDGPALVLSYDHLELVGAHSWREVLHSAFRGVGVRGIQDPLLHPVRWLLELRQGGLLGSPQAPERGGPPGPATSRFLLVSACRSRPLRGLAWLFPRGRDRRHGQRLHRGPYAPGPRAGCLGSSPARCPMSRLEGCPEEASSFSRTGPRCPQWFDRSRWLRGWVTDRA